MAEESQVLSRLCKSTVLLVGIMGCGVVKVEEVIAASNFPPFASRSAQSSKARASSPRDETNQAGKVHFLKIAKEIAIARRDFFLVIYLRFNTLENPAVCLYGGFEIFCYWWLQIPSSARLHSSIFIFFKLLYLTT